MSLSPPQPAGLFDTVVANGHCIGCGACAAFDPNIRVRLDPFGRYVATRESPGIAAAQAAARVCPFGDENPNEDALARESFVTHAPLEPHVGYQVACYAGWAVESDFRSEGSSGGLASWLLVELLAKGLVDHVVHVTPGRTTSPGSPLFRFAISSNAGEVRAKAKSRYYPVEMSGVLAQILEKPGRYAVVGIPCFIKAVRLACRESATLRDRVTFTVAIVCGHLKSTAFAELFAWQCGLGVDELSAIDFRTKVPGRPASSYAVTVSGNRGGEAISVTKSTSELVGSNWGHGMFKYKACDFCDDVVGETADISFGDAWLPEYVADSAGTNVVVVRRPALDALLTAAAAQGRLHLNDIPVEKVVESQAGGFRHRREGLAYRLHLEDQAGLWRPTKRVQASATHLSGKLRDIYTLRSEIARTSHEAFASAKASGSFGSFVEAMRPLTSRYDRHYRRPLPLRVLGKLKRFLHRLLRLGN